MVGNFRNKYQKLFEVKSLPYLFSDILSESYKSLEFLFVYCDGEWKSYLPKLVVERTLAEGLSFFSDADLFEEYKRKYLNWRENSQKKFATILGKEFISKDEAGLLLNEIVENHQFYIKTEFFFVDKAFEESDKNPVIKKNLEELSKIKNTAREYLNKIFFGEEAYLSIFLKQIGNQFGLKAEDLAWLSRNEILGLFEDPVIVEVTIRDRKSAYVMSSNGIRLDVMEGSEAEKMARSFSPPAREDELRGAVANKGRVCGKVKIISTGYDNYDRLHKEIELMTQGDILVADTTSPELLAACHKASAIVTNQGGLLSHAAIVSRELHIPCIVGTEVATKLLHDGDEVEVDAEKGIVKILKKA